MQLKKLIQFVLVTAFLFACGCALQLSVNSPEQIAPIEAQHALLVGPGQPMPEPQLIATPAAIHSASASYAWL